MGKMASWYWKSPQTVITTVFCVFVITTNHHINYNNILHWYIGIIMNSDTKKQYNNEFYRISAC